MASSFNNKLEQFIINELNGMKISILQNFDDNMNNRKNNPFCFFNDETSTAYMMVGRSFDSQLGTRLQKIAFWLAREKYGRESVPNLMILYNHKNTLFMTLVSDNIEKSTQQKIVWLKEESDLEKTIMHGRTKQIANGESTQYTKKYQLNTKKINYIKESIKPSKGKSNDRLVDLLYFDSNETINCFEIKSSGNLDTKNASANKTEIEELENIFSFINGKSYFATCYNNAGEGNEPIGGIFSEIPKRNQLIGSQFWKKVLPDSFSYNKFVKLYKKCFINSNIEKEISKKAKNE